MTSPSEIHGSRTMLWCMPRTVSTAFTKCLSVIEDTTVWLEPYCYCWAATVEYKRATNAELPMRFEGNEEVFQQAKSCMDISFCTNFEPDRLAYASTQYGIEHETSKHVFVKDMGFSMSTDTFRYLPRGFKHTFLIRNPFRTLYSFRESTWELFEIQQLESPLRGSEITHDTFELDRDDRYFRIRGHVKELYDLWMHVKENLDSEPVVIDTDDLLAKPKETMSAYCAAVGLPYSDSLVQWDASTDPLKTIKAPANDLLHDLPFYRRAITSSRFLPPNEMPSRDKMTPDVIRCSESVMKYYEEMFEQRLKV